ncbi:MAG: UvrD-helicase domain-containing protein [Clostridiales bacterium]|nr:UvrD-helicase domain-containing protein [Clostridiales bacterium]
MIQPQQLTLNTDKMLLSGHRRVYKTEGFIALTRKTMAIDTFVSRVAESIFYAGFSAPEGNCIAVETDDKAYTLFFRQNPSDPRLRRGDLIFYKFISNKSNEGGVDRGLSDYLITNPNAKVTLREASEVAPEQDFAKIYLVSTSGAMNFPLLNETQRKIVETENSNMLVQGVAGSGKTNVCVEKIVYCACRNYRGKVLYTTFSRALLSETQNRVSQFLRNIEDFLGYYKKGKVIFIDENHKRAIENKLGILFDTDDDGKIVESLERISTFLREKVDYLLIEDIYSQFFTKKRAVNESEFLSEYLAQRMSGALDKIKNIAPEIVYKEIYGMIFGKYEPDEPKDMMSREEYFNARRESFSRAECEVIYNVACDYVNYLAKNNLTDNNLMSRELLGAVEEPLYSVGIIDEAQDFTQVNLYLVKKLSRKLFCVGDALQMINPSYFNFGYVKRLMYGDVTGVSELKHNYRSTQTIETIAEALGELNRQRFGVHSFVLRGESVHSTMPSAAVFVKADNFVESLTDRRYENVTVIVSSQRKKEQLRNVLPKTEILTVAEAKGLERDIVVLVDVLTDNIDKWNYLENMTLNRKTADENSVFRYYFNLFYVGISRAKQYLFVSENVYPQAFTQLFNQCFERKNKQETLAKLLDVVGKIELDDEELIDRIDKFCALEQYENARFAADRLSTDELREQQLARIYVHKEYLRYGKYRDAGAEYWKRGMDAEAREMFTISGDEQLFPLMDACRQGSGVLDVDIVRFYPLVTDNDLAKRLILETVHNDYNAVISKQKLINQLFRGTK